MGIEIWSRQPNAGVQFQSLLSCKGNQSDDECKEKYLKINLKSTNPRKKSLHTEGMIFL